MRNKKYGPGKNIVKENVILSNIRNVFRNCEKYFSHDEASVRLSRILEAHFENEMAVSPPIKGQKAKKGEVADDDGGNRNAKDDDRGMHDARRSSSLDDNGNNRSADAPYGRSASSKSKKKKDKKDKKKEKKDKKK